jgi:glycosyltransferase involved in cell wall biosynthesis
MGNIPKVSVIIPTYNSAPYLPEALESVLSQSYQDFEIILVDDGSTDNTKEIIQPYQSILKYLYQENKGPGSARNLGLRFARGDYLVFLDADDVLYQDKLNPQVHILESNLNIDVVYSNGHLYKIGENGKESKKRFSQIGFLNVHLGAPQVSLPIISIQCPFPLFTAIVRKRLLQSVGGFDEKLVAMEDWDLWFRVAHVATFFYFDALVGKYRQVSGSFSDSFHRQSDATDQIQLKIENSEGFKGLSPQHKSNHYFNFGVQDLYYRKPDRALNKFKFAKKLTPNNLLVNLAYYSTLYLGYRAVNFYFLKRWLFGPHQKI